jgi:hypothetical protein
MATEEKCYNRDENSKTKQQQQEKKEEHFLLLLYISHSKLLWILMASTRVLPRVTL